MNPRRFYHWTKKISKGWKGFSRHFRKNVQLFSYGVARAQSSHLRKIAGCVGGRASSQRRRLQRFVSQAVEMDNFFQQWTRSLARHLKRARWVLVVDETKLKDQFGVMVVGIVFHERCIPLAWHVYEANDAAAYPAEGQVNLILRLLALVQAGLPRYAQVCVLADRGIGTSPDLMRGIMAMGWTFLFRVTKQSKLLLPDGQEVTFYDQVTQAGQSYQAAGLVFKKRGRIPAQVRVLWGPRAAERWALVTNDPALTGWEYAQRMWIEAAFRDLKSHGWQLQQNCFTCPQRLARFWILLVVAYAWLLIWGWSLEQAGCTQPAKRRPSGASTRQWSLFREGWLAFLAHHPPLIC